MLVLNTAQTYEARKVDEARGKFKKLFADQRQSLDLTMSSAAELLARELNLSQYHCLGIASEIERGLHFYGGKGRGLAREDAYERFWSYVNILMFSNEGKTKLRDLLPILDPEYNTLEALLR